MTQLLLKPCPQDEHVTQKQQSGYLRFLKLNHWMKNLQTCVPSQQLYESDAKVSVK